MGDSVSVMEEMAALPNEEWDGIREDASPPTLLAVPVPILPTQKLIVIHSSKMTLTNVQGLQCCTMVFIVVESVVVGRSEGESPTLSSKASAVVGSNRPNDKELSVCWRERREEKRG